MTIWADADSLPRAVRERIERRVRTERLRRPGAAIEAIFVANMASKAGMDADGISAIVVTPPVTADDYIVERAAPGDLVVTRDIPLAERMLTHGVAAINDRGTQWTTETVRERRSVRDFMAEARAMGLATADRGRTYGRAEEAAFADALDRALTKLLR